MGEQKRQSTVKPGIWLGIGVVVTLLVVSVALFAGWFLWNRATWGRPMSGGFGMMGWPTRRSGCDGTGRRLGGDRRLRGQETPLCGPGVDGDPQRDITRDDEVTLDEAEAAFEEYLHARGYDDLILSEVMEFEYNFYAIAEEAETGIGAMELLLDKASGAVGPEMGPNMMWNTKYGMHSSPGMGMMGSRRFGAENDVAPSEAAEIAQRWLDANRQDSRVEEDADPFYGYYTFHTVRAGEIEGMLSVHGQTGDVWYHTWHGDYIRMVEHDGHDDGH
jgi:hypothetical protein